MAFSKSESDSRGLSKRFGNAIPDDEKSNKGPTSGSKVIGVIKGRLTTSKQNVMSLNKGVCCTRGGNDLADGGDE